MRDGGLEGVEAVVQRQQRVPPNGNDDGLLFHGQHGRARLLRPHRLVSNGLALAPLLDCGGADTGAPGQRPHALLTSLDCATPCLCRGGAAVENLAHNSSLCAGVSVPPHSGTEHLSVLLLRASENAAPWLLREL